MTGLFEMLGIAVAGLLCTVGAIALAAYAFDWFIRKVDGRTLAKIERLTGRQEGQQ